MPRRSSAAASRPACGHLSWAILALSALVLSVAVAGGADVERLKVGVNVRAIVARILSRYPTKYAMYRELVQNANDAGASEVSFTLAQVDGKPSLVVSDDGKGFSPVDWDRLLTIASGNPDGAWARCWAGQWTGVES